MQNRISLLFALGTCCASTAVAAPLTAADLVAVLIAGLSVGEPLARAASPSSPRGARPAARARDPGGDRGRGDRARLAHAPGLARGLRSARAAAELGRRGDPHHGGGGAARLRGLVAVRDVLVSPGSRGLGVPVIPAPPLGGIGDERSWQHRVRALETIASGFPTGCEGVLVAVGDQVARVELFPSAWLLSRVRADVLRTAAFEALACPDRASMDREDAERFLRDLSDLPWTRREPVGLGFEVEGSGLGVSAGALFLGGALVHLSAAFAR